MSIFDDRERAEEAKLVLSEKNKFRVYARRNKLLGLWAAEKMGLDEEKRQDYAIEVVKSDMEEEGEEDVFRKIRADLDETISDDEIRKQMKLLLVTANEQIESES